MTVKKLFSQCNEKEVPPFIKLFSEEQQKYISSSSRTSIRYHLMIIKFYLDLAAKSSEICHVTVKQGLAYLFIQV